ncbi:aminopeptidase N-like [Glandiceps talaboti]
MSRQQRHRSNPMTYDNPVMVNYSGQTDNRHGRDVYAQYQSPSSYEPPLRQYQQRHTYSPQAPSNASSTASMSVPSTVDAVVRPPSRPPSERSDFPPSESIKFEGNKGFFLSYWRIFWIVVFVVLILLLVGLLIGFLKPKPSGGVANVTMSTETPTLDPSVLWHRVRLPGSVEPSRYDVDLRIDREKEIFSGSVSITFRCTEETDVVLIHVMALDFTDSLISIKAKESDKEIPIKNEFEFEERNYYVIELGESIEYNTEYVIQIEEFKGQLKEDFSGLYLSPYVDTNGVKRTMVVSALQPTFARKVFPCFDEPIYKAIFKLSITYPRFYQDQVLFSTEVEKTEDAEIGWVRDNFKETPVISTYNLGIVIGLLENRERSWAGGHKIQVWSRPDVIDEMNLLLDYAERSYTYFSGYFDIENPTNKIDLVAVPTHSALSSEHWGMVTILEKQVVFDYLQSSIRRQVQIAEIVSREIAHSWIGNLVTFEWWSDLWLKEGLATFFSYEAMSDIDPEFDDNAFDDIHLVEVVQKGLEADSYNTGHPLSDPSTQDVNTILSNYDEITSFKGFAVFHMLKLILGDTIFKAGIRSYLNKYKFQNADTNDLWEEFTQAYGHDVKELMNTWTSQPGYPLLTLTRNDDVSTSVAVDQSSFIIKPDDLTFDPEDTEFGNKWYIQFKYKARNQATTEMTTLQQENSNYEISVPSSTSNDAWILGNVDLNSFLRVNYQVKNWEAIIKQLQSDHTAFSVVSRATIIDDAFFLQRAGLLDTNTALRVTLYLTNEDSYPPWKAASRGFEYFRQRLYLTDLYGRFKRYVLGLLHNTWINLGWTPHILDTLQTRYLRTLLTGIACNYGDEDCTYNGLQYFTNWLTSHSPLPTDLRTEIFGVGVASSDSTQWQILWSQLNGQLLADDDIAIRESLTKSHDPWVLNRYMTWSLNFSVIPADESYMVIYRTSQNDIGSAVVFDFIVEHFDDILQVYTGNMYALNWIFKSVNTVNRVTQFKQFQSLRSKLPHDQSMKRIFDKAEEMMKINIEWLEKYQTVVGRYLQEHTSGG